MTNRDPYDNDESVNIPDFSSIKADDDIDLSQADFSEEQEEYEEDYEENSESFFRVKKPVFVILIVLLVVLLGLTAFGLIGKVSANNKLVSLQEEYDSYVSKNKANESALQDTITNLKAQIEELTKGEVALDQTTKYVVDTDDGVRIRSGAGTDFDVVGMAQKGETVEIISTKTENDNLWGKISDGKWICIKYGSEVFCTEQK